MASSVQNACAPEYECFICLDDNGLDYLRFGLCGCVGRAMHLSCQKRMVDAMGQEGHRCQVCCQRYANVDVVETMRIDWPVLCRLSTSLTIFMLGAGFVLGFLYEFLGVRGPACFCYKHGEELHIADARCEQAGGLVDCTRSVPIAYLLFFFGAAATILAACVHRHVTHFLRVHRLRTVQRRVRVSDISSGTRWPESASACVA